MITNKPFSSFFTLTLIFFVVYLALLFTISLGDNDIWFHLKIGENLLQTKNFPAQDPYSFTSKSAYIDHEWLAQLLFTAVYKFTGLEGIIFLRSFVISSCFVILLLGFKDKFPYTLFLMVPVVYLALAHAFPRPHILSWLLQTTLVVLLAKKNYQFIPPLLIIWANMHASFTLALFICALWMAQDFLLTKNKKLLWVLGLIFISPILNPFGYKIYLFSTQIKDYTWFVSEWQPFKSDSAFFWVWIVFILFLVFCYFRFAQKKIFFLLYALPLIYLGFTASRFPVVCSLYLFPLMIDTIPATFYSHSKRNLMVLNLSALLLLVAYFPASAYFKSPSTGINKRQVPYYSSLFIERNGLTKKLLNDYNFGGYLMWKFYPQSKVFIDGRLEVYAGEVMDDYLNFINNKEPETILDKYEIEALILRPEREITKKLIHECKWDLLYFDYNSVILVKPGVFPNVKRLYCLSPWGNRQPMETTKSIEEAEYLLRQNPDFFGAYKILAFLHIKNKNFSAAETCINKYLELHPEGIKDKETQFFLKKYATTVHS